MACPVEPGEAALEGHAPRRTVQHRSVAGDAVGPLPMVNLRIECLRATTDSQTVRGWPSHRVGSPMVRPDGSSRTDEPIVWRTGAAKRTSSDELGAH